MRIVGRTLGRKKGGKADLNGEQVASAVAYRGNRSNSQYRWLLDLFKDDYDLHFRVDPTSRKSGHGKVCIVVIIYIFKGNCLVVATGQSYCLPFGH